MQPSSLLTENEPYSSIREGLTRTKGKTSRIEYDRHYLPGVLSAFSVSQGL
jgi:hypothetical protein